MKKKSNIAQIIRRFYSTGNFEKDEIEQLEKWLDGFDTDQQIESWLLEKWEKADDADVHISIQALKEKIRSCDNSSGTSVGGGNGSIPGYKWTKLLTNYSVSIAASVLIVSMLGVLAYYTGFYLLNDPILITEETFQPDDDVQKSVVLTVGEDRQYELTSEIMELKEGGVTIKGNNNRLVLNPDTVKGVPFRKQIFSMIHVPFGKDYFLELADGTKVWLNAGSTFKFPDYFTDKGRIVELTGEAFFEVKSDKSNPFLVSAGETEICVTGTRFNVCNYSDETSGSVTLEEGKVSVTIDNTPYNLKQGEQLELTKEDGLVNIREVETNLYTSWKDGRYEFRDVDLAELTERLKKWYNVEFVFEKQSLEELRFTGMVKKEYSIDYFFQVLEKTTNIQFITDGNVILIQEEK